MLQSHNSDMGATTNADDSRWAAVTRRDRTAAGQFVSAVTRTGVVCRPTCPSRRPRRDRVRFFESAGAAEAAGFRACRRCQPTRSAAAAGTTAIERVTAYLADHVDEPVALSTLSRVAGWSPFHLQ